MTALNKLNPKLIHHALLRVPHLRHGPGLLRPRRQERRHPVCRPQVSSSHAPATRAHEYLLTLSDLYDPFSMPRRNAKKAPTGIGFAEALTISGDSDVQEKYVRLMSWMGEHAGRAGTVRWFDTSAPRPDPPPSYAGSSTRRRA